MSRFSKKQKNYHEREPRAPLNPEIKRSIGVIFLIILAVLMTLSYFGLAGTAGNALDRFLAIVFGQSRLLVPAVFLLVAFLTEIQKDYPYESAHTIGFLLIFFGVNGLIHLRFPLTESYRLALQGLGGGIFGWLGSSFLLSLFGFYATVIILGSSVIIALLLLLNTSLGKIIARQKQFFIALGGAGKIFFNVLKLFAASSPQIEYQDEPLSSEETSDKKQETVNEGPETRNKKNEIKDRGSETNDESHPIPYTLSPTPYNRGLPPLNLLVNVKSQPGAGDIKANQLMIQKTFSNFGIQVEMGEVRVGPSISQYSLRPADGVKLSKITALQNDLALALAAHPLRIEAPIPGKSLVGIEVPNRKVALVTLRELLEAEGFDQQKGEMTIALGKDVSGKAWFTKLNSLPHLLVAGATGSGKTVCLNTIILSLLFQHTPETLRFIMVDPKRVELPLYNGIPHLLTPVVTDVTKTINALRWTIGEMDRRFEILSKSGRRDIGSYNRVMEAKIPYLVFMVDELADLMASAGAEIEAGIIRLAQMARAVGIHLVLATQRPSVDVITGLIKANIPARIAFSVASLMDSRTILDAGGAEKLLGRGDMLWSGPDMSVPKRLQGAFISEEEIKKVVDFFKGDEPPQYLDEITTKQQSAMVFANSDGANGDDDPLLVEAIEVVKKAGKASASLLQRRIQVGYARAARLLDLMENRGLIGPADGAKPRKILMAVEGSGIIEGELTENQPLDAEESPFEKM